MYFFYMDESGTRDPSVGTPEKPKDHLYVLLTVGMNENQWAPFDQSITRIKLELINYLRQRDKQSFDLADCEVKSNWLRHPGGRAKQSPFLSALDDGAMKRIAKTYSAQMKARSVVIMAAVIDKRYLHAHITQETMHKKAYEFLLERIQMYMRDYHPMHNALIVMDDSGKQLNRSVTLRHALFQRKGNQNMKFPQIIEYPFFAASELSNGVQLADLLAYNVYRAFSSEDLAYPYFNVLKPYIYRRKTGKALDGLKVWPEASPLVPLAASFRHLQMKLPSTRRAVN